MLTPIMQQEKGVTMIEYALIAALVAVVVIATLTTVGDQLIAIFGDITTALSGASSGS